jgi:hypothetical protein
VLNYSIDDFTDDGVLKPGLFLTLIVAALSRFLFYGPLSLLASRGGITGGNSYIDVSVLSVDSPFPMLASIPPVVMLYILVARNSASRELTRNIWKHGRLILLVSVVCQLVLQIAEVAMAGVAGLPVLVGMIVTAYCTFYLATSGRVRDVFASFPSSKQDTEDGAG